MSRFVRAAGFAAAMAVAAFGTLYAGPSRAWEFNAPPAITAQMIIPAVPDHESGPGKQNGAPAEFGQDASPPVTPETPSAAEPQLSLAELVGDYATSRTSGSEHECLANAVYFEAKGEPLQGQLSVAEVVVNRSRSGRFPASVCGVVKQRGQFSFVRGGRLPSPPRATAAWQKAVAIAHIAMRDLADARTPKALFFHAKRVNPSWRGLRKVGAVGNHIFYR